jgi:hypothetical protein
MGTGKLYLNCKFFETTVKIIAKNNQILPSRFTLFFLFTTHEFSFIKSLLDYLNGSCISIIKIFETN